MGKPLSQDTQAFIEALHNLSVQINGLVSISGGISVTNFPISQTVSGIFYPAIQPVSGTFWPTTQPVSGSVSTTPLTSNLALITPSANITTTAVKIIGANANRKGLSLYNNSANSVYIKLGAAGNSGTDMTAILATFNQLPISQLFPVVIWTGEVWGIRNAGTGQVVATELL